MRRKKEGRETMFRAFLTIKLNMLNSNILFFNQIWKNIKKVLILGDESEGLNYSLKFLVF